MEFGRKMELFFYFALFLFALGLVSGEARTPPPDEEEVCPEGREVDLEKSLKDEEAQAKQIQDEIDHENYLDT